jgi:hypothetical protein
LTTQPSNGTTLIRFTATERAVLGAVGVLMIGIMAWAARTLYTSQIQDAVIVGVLERLQQDVSEVKADVKSVTVFRHTSEQAILDRLTRLEALVKP